MDLNPVQVFPSISAFSSVLLQLLLGLHVLCGHHVNSGYLIFTKTGMLISLEILSIKFLENFSAVLGLLHACMQMARQTWQTE
jgi:hypothetical protein